MIIISIDLRKIDQSRCKKVTLKNGDQASFCELVLIETPNGKFGDFMVKQGVTKEEREQRIEMPILGNGKNVGGASNQRQQPERRREQPSQPRRAAQPPQRRSQPDPDLDPASDEDIPWE